MQSKTAGEVVIMKLIFVRHGKDDDRFRGGWSHLDLIPEGIEQAKKLADHLKRNQTDLRISHIISSDLQRAITTATHISAALNLPISKETQVREMNNGDLAGMLNAEALVRYPGLFFSSLEMDESYPNGESPLDFYLRIKTWFEEFIDKRKNTQNNVINIVYHIVKNMEWSNKTRSFKISNCSIHILNADSMEFEVENKTDFLNG